MRKAVDFILSRLLVFLMGVMVVNVLWQVFTRFVLQSPSPFTDELARYLLIWVGLLGAAYATGQRMHLAIDIVPNNAGPRSQRVLQVVIALAVVGFALFVMIIGGLKLVYITLTLNQISPALSLPLGYVYTAVPLSGLLIIFYALLNLVDRHTPGWGPESVSEQPLT
jgi:TRAP-type C4-dicarboxylate transport system permease small subunit